MKEIYCECISRKLESISIIMTACFSKATVMDLLLALCFFNSIQSSPQMSSYRKLCSQLPHQRTPFPTFSSLLTASLQYPVLSSCYSLPTHCPWVTCHTLQYLFRVQVCLFILDLSPSIQYCYCAELRLNNHPIKCSCFNTTSSKKSTAFQQKDHRAAIDIWQKATTAEDHLFQDSSLRDDVLNILCLQCWVQNDNECTRRSTEWEEMQAHHRKREM